MRYIRFTFAVTLAAGFTAFLLFHRHAATLGAGDPARVPTSLPYFPPDAIWNQDISQSPVDPHSPEIINWLAGAGGWGRGRMQVDFSMRVLQADANTPQVAFRIAKEHRTADSDLVPMIPLPPQGGIEGQDNYRCNIAENDCHLLVADRSRHKLYEAYQANMEGSVMTATGLTLWDLGRVYPPSGRGDQCSSADAAGFPIAPLLFNADEIAAGSINHAIRFILPNERMRANVFVHPATHAGAPRGPDLAPPMGAHFRLKSSYDLTNLSPSAQVVARAMQKYGMFLSDGGNIALTAQSDADTHTKYRDVDFGPHELRSLRITDFEVLDLGTPIALTYACSRE